MSSLPPILSLKLPESRSVLSSLPPSAPRSLFHWLLLFLETPRPSHDCSKVRAILRAFADLHRLSYKEDSAGNVVLVRPPSSPSLASAPSLALQAHQDVVCSKTHDKVHDFDTDAVTPIYKHPWLKADGTTLGADNGIGMAAILAILEDAELKCGQIEGLFTAEEETTMGGAENIAPAPFLSSSMLLNLDSEEPSSVCVGCAGGVEYQVKIPVFRQDFDENQTKDYREIRLNLHGLLGGHTGIDIHKPRANALQVMGRLLDSVRHVDIAIGSLGGGNAPNAIPRHCEAVVWVGKEDVKEFKEKVAETYKRIQKEFEGVENVTPSSVSSDNKDGEAAPKVWTLEVEERETKTTTMVADSTTTMKIIDILMTIPHGVMRYVIGLDNEVDLSVAFSILTLKERTKGEHRDKSKGDDGGDWCIFHLFCRGSSSESMQDAVRRFQSFSRLVGSVKTEGFGLFPGWAPNLQSKALKCTVKAHKEMFGKEPRIYSVHAGLECGLIQGKYPQMDATSIGPLIEAAHSPDERLQVDTVDPFYRWLKRSIEIICEEGMKEKGIK